MKLFSVLLVLLIPLTSIAQRLDARRTPALNSAAANARVWAALNKDFAYIPGYQKEITYKRSGRHFEKERIELVSNKEIYIDEKWKKKLKTKFYVHLSNHAKKLPLVIFLPPVLGITPADHLLGKYLPKNSVHTILFDFGENLVDSNNEPKDINDGLRRGVIRFRYLLDYIQHELKDRVDLNNIGIYGMSMGAVAGGFVMGVFKHYISYGMLVVGGGNMPEIMTYSEQGLIKKLRRGMKIREGRRRGHNLSDAEFTNYLRKNLIYDPLYFADAALVDRIFFIEGGNDTGVPYKNQVEMRNAFGSNALRLLFKKGGHFPTVYKTLTNPDQIVAFFKYAFKNGTTRGFKHSLSGTDGFSD